MFKKLTQPKYLLFALAGLMVVALIAWFAVRVNRLQQTPRDTAKLVSFDYCGEELTKLCVVSFGRDADGSTLVNLFVPDEDFPLFYLKMIRTEGENVYECDKNDEVKTSVYCTGGALNLQERFEMQVLSVKGDQLLAQGNFTLTAFLINGSTAGVQPPQNATEAAQSTQTPATLTTSLGTPTTTASATPTAAKTIRATPTATSASYPSYP